MAQDYLAWDVFDFVVICGGYRAVPLLAFTAESMIQSEVKQEKTHSRDKYINRKSGMFYF